MKRTEIISLRTTREIKQEIEKIAKKKDWTTSKTIEHLIQEAIKRVGRTP